jgi:hypothetical protein
VISTSRPTTDDTATAYARYEKAARSERKTAWPRACSVNVPEHLREEISPAYHSRDVMRIGAGALATVALVALSSVGSTAQGSTRDMNRFSASRTKCTEQEVRSVVARFVVNFNDGDLRQVNRLFSPAGLFKWYSVSGPAGRLEDASLDRATLIPYLASRHRQGERLTLRSFQWKGYGLGYGQFLYSLTRSALDLQAESYFGKGAVLCLHPRTIAVWSMGPQ